jgi:methylglyoxal synthase
MHFIEMEPVKHIALIAHDHCKPDLIEWAKFNEGTLKKHMLYGTGTTGSLLKKEVGLEVFCFKSGPLGGDQQIGAYIVEGKIDVMIFFWDPLTAQPHDPDVKALIRIATVYNIPLAMSRATADFLIASPLLKGRYKRKVAEFALPSPIVNVND